MLYAPVRYFLAVVAGAGTPRGDPLIMVEARPPLRWFRLRISAIFAAVMAPSRPMSAGGSGFVSGVFRFAALREIPVCAALIISEAAIIPTAPMSSPS
jgi:hypothetical protein